MGRLSSWAAMLVLSWFALLMPARADLLDTPRFRQITVADGLPSNAVMGMAEDKDGYLWVATMDGLARYDGAGFRTWRKEDGLLDNSINAVVVDAQNRVWIGQDSGGVAMLDADRNLHQLNDAPGAMRITAPVWSLASLPDGSLWIGTMDAGLYRLDAAGRWTHFTHREDDPHALPGNRIPTMLLDPKGTLWICTDTALARWDGSGFRQVPAQVHGETGVERMAIDHAGNLWLSTVTETSVYRPDGTWTPRTRLTDAIPNQPMLLLQQRNGRFWLGDRRGVAYYDRGTTRHIRLDEPNTGRPLAPGFVSGLEDREGGVWLSSFDSGLWYLPSQDDRFSIFTHEPGAGPGRGSGRDWTTLMAHATAGPRQVWVADTRGYLDRLDLLTGVVVQRLAYDQADPGTGVANVVRPSSSGVLWIGAYPNLVRHDPVTGRQQAWSPGAATDRMLDAQVHAIAEDSEGRIWVMDQASNLQWRAADGRVLRTMRGGQRRGLPANIELFAMDRGPDDTMWVAGTQGLFRWSAVRDAFERVPGSRAEPVITFALAASGDAVWLSHPESIEQARWTGKALESIERITARDGLPRLNHTALAIDASGVAWATSMRGLTRIDIRNRHVRQYGMADGWPSQDAQRALHRLPESGTLVFHTSNALIAFDPAGVRPRLQRSPLVLESISVGSPQGRRELPLGGGFVLDADARDMQIVARVISFRNAREHAYRFRLEGHDSDWVDAGSSGERVYSRLSPGNWTLQVMGRNAEGVWSQPLTVRFSVQPPWWRTGWALSGFGILVVALLALLALEYRARVRRQHAHALSEQRRQLAEQTSEAKTRFLANLGHEVRTPLTGVLGMSELLLGTSLQTRQRNYVESIHRAGEHLLRLVNDALDLARVEAGRLELDARDFDVPELIRDVVDLMAPLAERRGLQFSDAIDAAVPRVLHGDRTRVEQILLNLLGNAIKFTDSGHVTLEVLPLQPQGLRLRVGDSGPGMTSEQQQRLFRRFEQAEGAKTTARYGGSGLGLAISQELALAMGGRIDVQSVLGEGTVFTVDLPLPSGSAATVPADPASPLGRLTILLVEDDPTVAEVVVALLRSQGHAAVHAAHGLEALAMLADQEIDVALLDLDLPGIDGIALAGQLRAMGFGKPLVALTARADAEAEAQVQAAGFDGFLRKPVTGAMLAEGIARALGDGARTPV